MIKIKRPIAIILLAFTLILPVTLTYRAKKEVLTIALADKIEILNPYIAKSPLEYYISTLISDTLLKLPRSLGNSETYRPWIICHLEHDVAYMEWKVKVLNNLTWSNGEKVVLNEVAELINKTLKLPPWKNVVKLKNISLEEDGIILELEYPNPYLPKILASIPAIHPNHISDDPKLLLKAPHMGPYKVLLARNGVLVLASNNHYFKLSKIRYGEIKIIYGIGDEEAFNMLLKGKADIAIVKKPEIAYEAFTKGLTIYLSWPLTYIAVQAENERGKEILRILRYTLDLNDLSNRLMNVTEPLIIGRVDSDYIYTYIPQAILPKEVAILRWYIRKLRYLGQVMTKNISEARKIAETIRVKNVKLRCECRDPQWRIIKNYIEEKLKLVGLQPIDVNSGEDIRIARIQYYKTPIPYAFIPEVLKHKGLIKNKTTIILAENATRLLAKATLVQVQGYISKENVMLPLVYETYIIVVRRGIELSNFSYPIIDISYFMIKTEKANLEGVMLKVTKLNVTLILLLTIVAFIFLLVRKELMVQGSPQA